MYILSNGSITLKIIHHVIVFWTLQADSKGQAYGDHIAQ